MPIGGDPTPSENAELATALRDYSKRVGPDDFTGLTGFIERHPASSWNAALETNLGLEYFHTGHYSKALTAWTEAWECAKNAQDLKGRALADRAVGELLCLHARLGHMVELKALLESVAGRVFSGLATEKIAGAREGLSTMQNHPEVAFRCGPHALHQIVLATHPNNPGSDVIHDSASTSKGFSLHQLKELSHRLGLNFRMAFRDRGASFVTPSVVHLKLDHYAALMRREGDRYLLKDPTFGNDAWMTGEALEAEASGYFLVPPGDLQDGWRPVEEPDGHTVWGRGQTTGNDPAPTGPCDPQSPGGESCPKDDADCGGMAVPRVHLMPVSLNLRDVPVGYTPPVGPAVRFMVRYNQRDAPPSSNARYSNFGPKWTFDWFAYITDMPDIIASDVDYYMMGGGTRRFTGYNRATQTFAPQQFDQTTLARIAPDTYEMTSRDGSRKIFGRPDVFITKRNILLTKCIDPFGNAVSLAYDTQLRLLTITDAINQVTTLSYGNPTDIFKITKVTDPFGRAAVFEYDSSNRLSKITDVIGMSSEFVYDDPSGDFITTLTTPYGVTTFAKSENGTTRSLQTQYPDGNTDRVEYNQSIGLGIASIDPRNSVPIGMTTSNIFLVSRNTYFWDKKTYAEASGDYTRAHIFHWLHTRDMWTTAGILESVKKPLEGRVWYDYAGQPSGYRGSQIIGNTNRPSHIGRVLDDGTTQLYTYEYNGLGNVTREVDPIGRTLTYLYDSTNGVDLLETRQTRAGQDELQSRSTYNAQHLPLTVTDAAGQVTAYTYNVRGQLLTRTNAKNETTTNHYDVNGYLTSIDGPLPGSSTVFSYDTAGRMRGKTDESGYTLTFDYDILDRLTRIAFPDGSFDQFDYTRLDCTLITDRAGRRTALEYNRVRQMTKRTDPLNRVTLYRWCKCGALRSVTDPMARTTAWRHDIQGRVTGKDYPDGSKITYRYESTISRLRQRIDEQLQVTQYTYNRDDTLSDISYTNAAVATPPVAFTYDANYRRLHSMSDGTGMTTYGYVPIGPVVSLGAGRLASEGGTLPDDIITYSYDELGRRVSIAINGVASSVTYDAAGRVTTTTSALGVFNNTYDGLSFLKSSESYPNGQTVEYDYSGNALDRQLRRITNKRGLTSISEFVYERGVRTGRITSWSQQAGSRSPSVYGLTYDDVDQLTSASLSEGGRVVSTVGYSYDRGANRLTEQVGVTTREFFYNALDQLTSIVPDPGITATYQWDAEHRLVSASIGTQRTQLMYDGLGRRVGIRVFANDVEVSHRRFVWCNGEVCEERTPAGVVSKRFFTEGMRVENGSAGDNYYYSRDHLATIRELTDSTGNVRARYSYSLFGHSTRVSGDVDAEFGYAGMQWISALGVNGTRFRLYNPDIARWLSRDALRDVELFEGSNVYAYVGNDPVNRVDPLGLCSCENEVRARYGAFGAMYVACAGIAAPTPGWWRLIPVAGCAVTAYVAYAAEVALRDCEKRCIPSTPEPTPEPPPVPPREPADACEPFGTFDSVPIPCNTAPVCEGPPIPASFP